MAKINVIGGTGYAGSNIVREAVKRGHDVTSFSRNLPETPVDGARYVTGSVLDADFLATTAAGADVVIEALSPRGELVGKLEGVFDALLPHVKGSGARLGVIGGAGSLQVAPGGPLVMDTPGFPAEILPESKTAGALLETLKAGSDKLSWFYVSPAGGFGGFAPGEATGAYRTGGDVLLVDDEGNSNISGADFALAVVDEVESPAHNNQRFTVAY
ncbi:NAD-dependent epimerase [Arthrobacter psychrolactophilus]|uniref:NAD-dependent epimerase n=1 Tax=Arthrobacter psychrolactophilus TaxID=92442 RepID=A0A2V5J617_9MICC|nr:NAD(P)H-binding protein [Arthrobacter psychrolactophilus]PYI37990.1 NAD-dependent epimerase [Arthrobacter psychrolactophilus]